MRARERMDWNRPSQAFRYFDGTPADRAESALYTTQDCGGSKVMRARGNVVARLDAGKRPRGRDVRALEDAARMSGNDLPAFAAPPRVTTPEPRRVASLDEWRASPPVRRERRRGIVIGFALAMVMYGVGSLALVLAFHALEARP